ncbi:MAG: hypothetical protein ACKN9Y_04470, partial [Bacteroidota bacterium]
MNYCILLLLLLCSLQAQERPFGIINSNECQQLRTRNEYASLIAGIYASAKVNIPTGNQSTGDRRLRAGIAKNAAFIAYLNRYVIKDSLAILPTLEKETLINTSITVLQQCQTSIPQLSITSPNA